MKYAIHVHSEYVEAVTSGEVSLFDGKACIDAAFMHCRQFGLSKVLVNALKLSDEVSIAARFGLGEYLAANATLRVRVAILVSTKLAHESKALQNTANNRGGQVITTDSMDDALKFLGIAAL